jgi:Zn-finger nucleic acid-binding protein
VCGERLRAVERSGVEIDICPGCKGVWLDRGEMEKLIALELRNGGEYAAPVGEPARPVRTSHDDHDRHGHDDHDRKRDSSHDDNRYGHGDSKSGQRRRGSWLGDILGGIGGGDD